MCKGMRKLQGKQREKMQLIGGREGPSDPNWVKRIRCLPMRGAILRLSPLEFPEAFKRRFKLPPNFVSKYKRSCPDRHRKLPQPSCGLWKKAKSR